jgi:catechol 2,3-dioxygenase
MTEPSPNDPDLRIDPTLRIAATELAVSNLSRSADFYERTLGLPLIERDDTHARLGPEREHPLLTLTQLAAPTRVPPRSSGLFHIALLHPTRAGLAETVRRVAQQRWPIDGASDHGVSEALYLSDPDGLGIEIYSDRPRAQWNRPASGHGVEMFTLPLDLEGLLAQAPGTPAERIAAGTVIGHVHLKVADVARAVAFYRDTLGFEEQTRIPSAGFLSAGGYHHHIGLNSWQSAGGTPAPDSAPGLREVQFKLSGPDAVRTVERGLRESPSSEALAPAAARPAGESPHSLADHDSLSVNDPDDNRLSFSAQSPA